MAITGSIVRTEDGTVAYFKNSCKFNEGVDCSPLGRKCERCGWNPAVAKERLLQICFDKGISIPESVWESM